MAALIIASPEYFIKAGGTAPGFLTKLYNDALGRGLDPAALAFLPQVSAGDRLGVARSVLRSLEGRIVEVTRAYNSDLRRVVDPAGLVFWVSQLRKDDPGNNDANFMAGLFGSLEYFLRAPGFGTPAAFALA
jgi:hypothetical protein